MISGLSVFKMKSSLGKLRKFALQKSDAKEKRDHQPPAHLDELAQASQDMQEMRNCYDSLLSAAAATANSAYEFSESLLEMGTCLQEKTSLNDDGESGRVLSMLGKVQLELQKLADCYRSHVILTITNPSESLLVELRKVEEMKLQCDEKRQAYEYMVMQHKEKGRLRGGKAESFTSQQIQEARDEYDEVARLCVFRVKSLKQGQCRSLITQAARHHSAQLNFFRKGIKSLEAVEPHIRLAAEKHHIDFQLTGLHDGEDGESESVNSYDETNDGGELSFDYRQDKQGLDSLGASRISMEVDLPHAQASKPEETEINVGKNAGEQYFSRRPQSGSSYSAPIFAEKFDQAERIRDKQPSVRKFHTYVLPTPLDAKSSSSRTTNFVPLSNHPNTEKHENYFHDNLSASAISKSPLVVKESNIRKPSIQLPPPMAEGLSITVSPRDSHNPFDTKKNKRQAFSGPLASKPWPTKPFLSTSGPITSAEPPQQTPGLLSRVPIPHPSSSSHVSHSASPPLVSSPKISELHELPRPPGSLASKPTSSSGPIGFRHQEASSTNRSPSPASTLPVPPLTVPRSFSIPSSNQRAMSVHAAKLLESPKFPQKAEVDSPPLTPISLSNMKSLSTVSNATLDSGKIRGGS